MRAAKQAPESNRGKFFDTYTAVYGSLGAVIILMIWFYLFGVAIPIGGEVNSVLENAAAQAGEPKAKLAGEKSPLGDQKIELIN